MMKRFLPLIEKMSMRSLLRLDFRYFTLGGAVFLLALARVQASSADDFITLLKQAPSRIEDTDHKEVDSSVLRLDSKWTGDKCNFTLTNISRTPVHVGNIILF